MQDSNQEILAIIIIGGIIALLLVGFVITTLFLYQKRQHKQEKQLSRLREEFNQELLNSQIEIQENTMQAISQELHDNVKQQLAFVSITMGIMAYQTTGENLETINTSKEYIDKVITDIQQLALSLHTDRIADVGLIETISTEVANIKRLGFLDVTYQCDTYYNYFDGKTTIFLYRMLQETLQNIIKHASATHITIRVFSSDVNTFVIEVKDNGKGFDLEEKKLQPATAGVGVKSMLNRANLIGATIKIDSEIGKGTTVKISIPIPNEETIIKN